MSATCICSPAEIDGHPYSPFWAGVFGECIYTPKQQFAVVCGLISIVLYGVALVPQVKKNYERKSVEGLSWGLFVTWTFGDICNTAGAILTQQFATQVWTGVYFLLTEVLFLCQYVYYQYLYKGPRYDELPTSAGAADHGGSGADGRAAEYAPHYAGEPHHLHGHDAHGAYAHAHAHSHDAAAAGTPHTRRKSSTAGPPMVATHVAPQQPTEITALLSASSTMPTPRPAGGTGGARPASPGHTSYMAVAAVVPLAIVAALLQAHAGTALAPPPGAGFSSYSAASPALGTMHILPKLPLCGAPREVPPYAFRIGQILAWSSGLLYFCSRIPQIVTNYQLQSVSGISISLFVITLTANLFYGASVLPRLDEMPLEKFITSTLPYLVGSVGTLLFDGIIIAQSIIYNRLRPRREESVAIEDDAADAYLADTETA